MPATELLDAIHALLATPALCSLQRVHARGMLLRLAKSTQVVVFMPLMQAPNVPAAIITGAKHEPTLSSRVGSRCTVMTPAASTAATVVDELHELAAKSLAISLRKCENVNQMQCKRCFLVVSITINTSVKAAPHDVKPCLHCMPLHAAWDTDTPVGSTRSSVLCC